MNFIQILIGAGLIVLTSCNHDTTELSDAASKTKHLNETVNYEKDTSFYDSISPNYVRLKLFSVKYGERYFGNKMNITIPEKVRYTLIDSDDSLFLIARSCGSSCTYYRLINIKTGKEIFDGYDLVHYDLKERVIIEEKSNKLNLIKIKGSQIRIVDSFTIEEDVQCPVLTDCIDHKEIDTLKNKITLKIEFVQLGFANFKEITFQY